MTERKKTTTRKKKSTGGLGESMQSLGKVEVIFVLVTLFCFFAWAISRCSKSSARTSNPTTETETPANTGEGTISSPAAANTPSNPTYDMDETPATPATPPPSASGETEVVSRPGGNTSTSGRRDYTPLYVTLEGLKVRKEPQLNGSIVTKLSLHDEVFFMEKRTDFRQKINIGGEYTNEPWVYVKTRKGHVGWVYGAGVHYFKWDRLKDPLPSIDEDGEEVVE